jgi:hypothetical protein
MGEAPVDFEILGAIRDIEVIARGRTVRIRRALRRRFGGRNWQKKKGLARIRDDHGWLGEAEIHWYEAHGIGRVWWKIKRRIETQ